MNNDTSPWMDGYNFAREEIAGELRKLPRYECSSTFGHNGASMTREMDGDYYRVDDIALIMREEADRG